MGTHPIFESDFDCLTDFQIGTDQRMVTGPIANEQCEPITNSPTVVADQAPVDAVSEHEVFLADELLVLEDSSRVAPSVEALACGLAMSSRNFNNNSNSTSVVADQAPGDDEEGVEGDADSLLDRRRHGQGPRQQGLLPRPRSQEEGQEGSQGQARGEIQDGQEQVVLQQAPLLDIDSL